MLAPQEAPGPEAPTLGIDGFTFSDLHRTDRLPALSAAFDAHLRTADAALAERFYRYRAAEQGTGPAHGLSKPDESQLLVGVAGHLSAFLARLFGVEAEAARLRGSVEAERPRFDLKRDFMIKRVFKKGAKDRPTAADLPALRAQAEPLLGGPAAANDELAFAATVKRLTDQGDAAGLDLLDRFTFARCQDPGERARLHGWASLKLPKAIDPHALVELVRDDPSLPESFVGPQQTRRRRDGFKLTDRRAHALEILSEVDYCLYCHEREKDSCSKGLRDPKGAFKPNALGIALAGCPLEERISEMHLLKSRGDSVGALAMICVDNPMLPGTGHRICNDCMKACIFQKQEPVNIPQIETAVLSEVLHLPWGLEIYGLLTRWNPLRVKRPHALPYNGKNVLVVGMGPAGYTLAHHLLNEGFGVVGIDGLKIEPLPRTWLSDGAGTPRPIRDFAALEEELDERVLAGFGGVSEYGITVRWDKNFLTLLHLTLCRRDRFRLFGGVRFGGTLSAEEAFELGFDHVALASGAGRPTVVPMKNGLARGIRQASDFLMALQLTGAFKRDAMANLQVRLPAVVIGGGLTAIDTATELAAYYPVQVEKLLERWETLAREKPEGALRRAFRSDEQATLDEMLAHGRAVREERARAKAAGEAPDFGKLVDAWGGVRIVYRRSVVDSPAYRLNHEEVLKSLEEGIRYVERMSPVEALVDADGQVRALRFERQVERDGKLAGSGDFVEMPARTVCVAAGTSPNIVYEKERRGSFELDEKGQFFQLYRAEPDGRFTKASRQAIGTPKSHAGFFTSYVGPRGQRVSYYGDNHPAYAGSVVKAMASARDGYPEIVRLFEAELRALRPEEQPLRDARFAALAAKLDDGLRARVERVERLTPTIVEVVVRAPFAARHFRPGQFYRLQNYETEARAAGGTRLLMEGLALTGAWTDPDRGLLSLIVLEMGGSSRLCASLRPGEPVVVMGPTGAPTEIPEGETVLLCGGGLGNAVLFSIARALRDHGNRVLYFAGYRSQADLFKRDEIEAATDQVIWSVDSGEPIAPRRPQDRSFVGNIVQALVAFGEGKLGERVAPLSDVSRLIAIGSDRMMAAVKEARHGVLAPHLSRAEAIGSINSPMQCMMKEICAQCLQRHVDPATGKETVVFSCFNQDQRLDQVDFQNLGARLRQNGVLEKVTNAWLDHLLAGPASDLVRI
ncbi:MAG TPA: FAD-dependent oxidoreductase [Myxococcales bacterium]|nr:FAD-dependent oxidoreductase [Myxococcales bacterium]